MEEVEEQQRQEQEQEQEQEQQEQEQEQQQQQQQQGQGQEQGQEGQRKAAHREGDQQPGVSPCQQPISAAAAARLRAQEGAQAAQVAPAAAAAAAASGSGARTPLQTQQAQPPGSSGSQAPGACATCGKVEGAKGLRLRLCRGCLAVNFCSHECYRAFWRTHKPFCKQEQARQAAQQQQQQQQQQKQQHVFMHVRFNAGATLTHAPSFLLSLAKLCPHMCSLCRRPCPCPHLNMTSKCICKDDPSRRVRGFAGPRRVY